MIRKPVKQMTDAEVLAALHDQIVTLDLHIARGEAVAKDCEARGEGRGIGPLLARLRGRAMRRRLARWTAMLETVLSVHDELRRCL